MNCKLEDNWIKIMKNKMKRGTFQGETGKIRGDVDYENFKMRMEGFRRERLYIDLTNPSISDSLVCKISKYFYDEELNKSCYSCLMNSIKYISSNQEYWDAIPFNEDGSKFQLTPEFQLALKQAGVLFALFGEEPQKCKCQKNFAQDEMKSLAIKVSILFAMMSNLNYFRKRISSFSNARNLNNPQSELIQTADEVSRNNPTAVRFPWVSRIISQHLVENLTLFYPLKKEINDFNKVFQDITNWILGAQSHYIRSVKDPSWPLLSALSSDLDEIKNRFGNTVTIQDVIEWNDSIYISIYGHHRLIRRGNCVIPTDVHEFGYGLYKTLIEYIEMPAGQEGYLFERIVQELIVTLLDGCNLFSGAYIVKKGSGIKFENDFILEIQNNIVLGECKNKKRYNNPAAGVEQSEKNIKEDAHKQLMDQRDALLDPDSPGYIRLKNGKQYNTVNGISNIFQIAVHRHEYIYPDYKDIMEGELNKASAGTHFFSLEGLVFALYTAKDGNDFLRYLKFRKEYIEFWKSRNIRGVENSKNILMDEFDICVSYVNGDKGRHSIVSYRCESQYIWDIPSRKGWNIFLKSVYNSDCGGICKDNIKSGAGIKMNIPNDECEKMKDINDLICFQFKG
jgi:hypothetical protein